MAKKKELERDEDAGNDSKSAKQVKKAFTIRLEDESSRFRSVIGQELKRRYEQAGWTVTIDTGSCWKDGDWYNVIII